MNTEARFLLAVVLMLAVLVGGNLLFPPAVPDEEAPPADPALVEEPVPADPEPAPAEPAPQDPPAPEDVATDPDLPELDAPAQDVPAPQLPAPDVAEQPVVVEGPLYRFAFSNVGARLTSAELLEFRSVPRDGAVELVASGDVGMLGSRIVVEADTIDLRRVPFEVSPADGLTLDPDAGPQTLTFRYEHPTEPFSFEMRYTFDPGEYLIRAEGRVQGVSRGLLVTHLGDGVAFNEVDEGVEGRSMAYVVNHLQQGIRQTELSSVSDPLREEGPFHWAVVKSQYFLVGVLPPHRPGDPAYLGGLLASPAPEERAEVAVTQSIGTGGTFDFRVFAGPQDYQLLSALGNDFQEVSPVGWRFIRPILRPFVGVIMWVLVTLHETLQVGYGWVLMLVGVLMRLVLFPLNHKAMKAQLRNMAVQPLLKEIQTKYKDQPEKMQKELMRLYKEHGFNPLAGCWPMLLPWPVLIALFFVFQNTIELRGVPFGWLPDLAAKDPLFILPVLLGISMFLLQWISLRTMEEVAPQMKMMMWFLPIFMVVIFANLPSGLNLYYLTANVATLPQSWWIANERQKVQAKGPPEPVKA